MFVFALIAALASGAASTSVQAGGAASKVTFPLRLDGNTTVSGLSAGAFMAVQFAVAFSASVSGAGVFAGGPYYCAQDELTTALTECMDFNVLLDPTSLAAAAQSYASNGQIDALGNVTRQRYYLFSGRADSTVGLGAVQAVETVMNTLGTPASNFVTEYTLQAGHGMPTLSYGVQCSQTASPFITNCGYDGAGAALKQLYGSLKPRGSQLSGNWLTLQTFNFAPAGWLNIEMSLGDNIHVYVPSSCAAGAACSLHIVFHGCQQSEEFVGNVYYKYTGYAEWAETNGFVLMFPQTLSNPLLSNPEGCFDWWGYTDSSYVTRAGPQMATFRNAARYLGAKFL